jgi:hypothetical protein
VTSFRDRRIVERIGKWLPPLTLLLVALAIGMFRMGDSGPLWPDEPRYANGAAMIHDWLLSGELLSPYRFAQENYAQYPAFSIPFHPPGYPAAMAVFFLFTTVSYAAARVFVALCAGCLGCCFYAVLRSGEIGRTHSLLCSLLLLSTPEIALWSRSAMSEVPSTAAIMGASLVFLLWFWRNHPVYCWLAFGAALFAFLCRVTTAGVLPGWILFVVLMGQWRRLVSWHVILPALLYLAVGAAQVHLAAKFARYEVAIHGAGTEWSWQHLGYLAGVLAPLAYWGTAWLAPFAALRSLALARRFPLGLFFLCWLASYAGFMFIMTTSFEPRYFIGAVPAMAGVCASFFVGGSGRTTRRRWLPATVMVLAIGMNASAALQFPPGLVGYEPVGRCLASLDKPGNVLLCCWEDQDLIFRYRSWAPKSQRAMLRGDRHLVMRAPLYANVETVTLVKDERELTDLIRRGRARYVVTSVSPNKTYSDRFPEIGLTHRVASARSEQFRLIEKFPLRLQDSLPGITADVYVWEYLGELPTGPSELNIRIPTADMTLKSAF